MSENLLHQMGFSHLLRDRTDILCLSEVCDVPQSCVVNVKASATLVSLTWEEDSVTSLEFPFLSACVNSLIWSHRSCGTSSAGDTETSAWQAPRQLWAGGWTRPPEIPLRSQTCKRKSRASGNSVLEEDGQTRRIPGDNDNKLTKIFNRKPKISNKRTCNFCNNLDVPSSTKLK